MQSRNPLVRAVFMALGVFFVALGVIGAFLPVMPTVPFLIVAAACFTRSSSRLEAWLLNHRQFGPPLIAWRERGAIPRRAKWLALAGSSCGFIFFLLLSPAGWMIAGMVGIVIAGSMIYVFSRPDA